MGKCIEGSEKPFHETVKECWANVTVQEEIVSRALKAEKNIYLATQFLKNMEKNSVPLISEIIDLCRTVKSGISGIQLSDETAIGRYPLESIELVFSAFKNSLE